MATPHDGHVSRRGSRKGFDPRLRLTVDRVVRGDFGGCVRLPGADLSKLLAAAAFAVAPDARSSGSTTRSPTPTGDGSQPTIRDRRRCTTSTRPWALTDAEFATLHDWLHRVGGAA